MSAKTGHTGIIQWWRPHRPRRGASAGGWKHGLAPGPQFRALGLVGTKPYGITLQSGRPFTTRQRLRLGMTPAGSVRFGVAAAGAGVMISGEVWL